MSAAVTTRPNVPVTGISSVRAARRAALSSSTAPFADFAERTRSLCFRLVPGAKTQVANPVSRICCRHCGQRQTACQSAQIVAAGRRIRVRCTQTPVRQAALYLASDDGSYPCHCLLQYRESAAVVRYDAASRNRDQAELGCMAAAYRAAAFDREPLIAVVGGIMGLFMAALGI